MTASIKASTSKQNTSNVKVAAIQMASSPHVTPNLTEAERLIGLAADQSAKVVLLPEYFCIMGAKEHDKVQVREKDGDGPIQRFLAKMAKKHKIWLIGGSVPLVSNFPNKVRNSCLVYNDKGEQVARYDKIHLFGLDLGTEHYHEENTIEPGDKIVVVETPYGKIGLSICYDLRFPEVYRRLVSEGAEIFSVPSAFTCPTGRAHWEVLLRARAIEDLSFVIAAAQTGIHDSDRETYGDSLIADYWGRVLNRLPRGSGVVLAALDRERQAATRQSFPALGHRVLK